MSDNTINFVAYVCELQKLAADLVLLRDRAQRGVLTVEGVVELGNRAEELQNVVISDGIQVAEKFCVSCVRPMGVSEARENSGFCHVCL